MKKLIIIALLLVGVGAVAFTLYTNKEEMNEAATLAMKSSEYISVTVQKVEEKTVNRNFEANGVFEPSQELKLMSETSGAVVKIYKKKGSFVKRGDLIVQIDDRLIRSEYTIAKLNRDQAEKDLKRFENLANTDAITKKQLEENEKAFKIADAQLAALQKRLDDTQVTAPISGFINEDYYEMGALVSPGMPLADIINKSPLKLSVNVTESEISKVKIGDEIPVKVNAISNQEFTGKVHFISDMADASFKYEVELVMNSKNQDQIKPGMFGTAQFKFSQDEKVLKIDRKSIAGSLKDPGVYLIKNGVAVYQPVKINPLDDGTVEILDGLKAGDEVIASGLINVKEGTKVKVQ
ncbi:efflux RND transporter periplasmic adaptor subunit [Algoriphagus halophytocola]|uniref:Efflux RND transporter periplasmic adaptor subunit n=1 Tax=Algoriphagus halophytocola TaxID=2991499 RepID=A0ABY6MHU4_9BACT|nr:MULTISPECIES: efflux RND transporter periplasmic adaptor subunit [unclassified Algoriphagus]UZD23361.1 efflux RND transporter periplasmic adaptor subunit [Algoriphagus sp. TR-M5]WBL44656.1 efflux RND transporter periplasmic adaptor subunit [Algoriphagus sp. TR-M9]